MTEIEETKNAAEPGQAAAGKKKKKGKKRGIRSLQDFALEVLVCVAILYVLFAHIIGICQMPTADMYPGIGSGDFLLYYRLDKDPKAQDVVVLTKNDTRYVARVVAVAGDTIEIKKDGTIVINGYTMQETNIFYETYPLKGFTEYPLTLQDGECFVMADRRGETEDSRFYGPVKYKELDGTVLSVFRRTNL